jgi:hypothetical protein
MFGPKGPKPLETILMTWMIKIQMYIIIHISSYLDLMLNTQCCYNLYKNVEYS